MKPTQNLLVFSFYAYSHGLENTEKTDATVIPALMVTKEMDEYFNCKVSELWTE